MTQRQPPSQTMQAIMDIQNMMDNPHTVTAQSYKALKKRLKSFSQEDLDMVRSHFENVQMRRSDMGLAKPINRISRVSDTPQPVKAQKVVHPFSFTLSSDCHHLEELEEIQAAKLRYARERAEADEKKNARIEELAEAVRAANERPIHITVHIPEIKVPDIIMPAAVNRVVVEKPDPVVVNVAPAPREEHGEYDIIPLRDENGDVSRYRRVKR